MSSENPSSLTEARANIRAQTRLAESDILRDLMAASEPDVNQRANATAQAIGFVETLRSEKDLGLMEVFLAEYGLSTDEGVALMCLAEALLRVPDNETIDALIEDKIVSSRWQDHVGDSDSTLVNASTLALMLVGKVLEPAPPAGVLAVVRGATKRLGEPVIRAAIGRSMKLLGKQFVLGRTIEEAVRQGAPDQKLGFSFSYDMLGEAAMTADDAAAYYKAYWQAIAYLAKRSSNADIRDNPGISIKLSALHPRYEEGQRTRIMAELVPLVSKLAVAAKTAGMGLNIDAEETDRLDLSLDVIEAVLRSDELAGWDGFGVVVQAYGKRAGGVINWLYALAGELDRKIMVRLVKGAYWDTEIKRAQVDGVEDFPVFARKVATDVSYICCANRLFAMTDRIYPQFATHNAHTVATILGLAGDDKPFEFQRLHGMGEALLNTVMQRENCRCRIYAPVGAHKDLLAYLVRRLLENGANSSFVNQIIDETVPANVVAADPFGALTDASPVCDGAIALPPMLYGTSRQNAKGWDLRNPSDIAAFDGERAPFLSRQWRAEPCQNSLGGRMEVEIVNPADSRDRVGVAVQIDAAGAQAAITAAQPWAAGVGDRAAILCKAADLFEESSGEIFALLTREAGKTPVDAVAELREAVDFLRYYAAEARHHSERNPCGIFVCISPWNFPLAIFTGQVAAALVTGNAVLAKPAETTPLIAALAVRLMHAAGVPENALQLLPGTGQAVGGALTSDPRVSGVCFTGSTTTAQTISRAMAQHLTPHAPLIAETGGINAMIVDSTALAEQAVRDIVASAFQSAGQRCSALRVLYVQTDIADHLLGMLYGAMDALVIGNPWEFDTDVGPVIDRPAKQMIEDYCRRAKSEGRILKQLACPQADNFVPPTVITVDGIEQLEREIFGPVLHVATFEAQEIDAVVDAVNNTGYGLTFGLHTRINDRVDHIARRIRVGNFYVNRNQIGAVVGSQPFGGEGLSGTGPKAGGPHYLPRFCSSPDRAELSTVSGTEKTLELEAVQRAINRVQKQPPEGGRPIHTVDMPGPTGEKNQLSLYPRGLVLCLGPTQEDAQAQETIARQCGCAVLIAAPGAVGEHSMSGVVSPDDLTLLEGIAAVALWSDEADLKKARRALAARNGPLIPLLTSREMGRWCQLERHICVDTTAAGGNASLLSAGL